MLPATHTLPSALNKAFRTGRVLRLDSLRRWCDPFDDSTDCPHDPELPVRAQFDRMEAQDLFVYPSGLVQETIDVQWFWERRGPGVRFARIGTAFDILEFCRWNRVNPDYVYPVHPDRIHGTQVRYDHPNGLGAYMFLQAHGFRFRL